MGLGRVYKIGRDGARIIDKADDIRRAVDKGNEVVRNVERGNDVTKNINRQGQLVEEFSKNPSFIKKSKQLLSEGEVTVGSFDEANALRKYTFPDARKVPGAGTKTGPVSSGDSFAKNSYKTDYLIDSKTGRIFGHSLNNVHAQNPHINVIFEDETYTILIEKTRGHLR